MTLQKVAYAQNKKEQRIRHVNIMTRVNGFETPQNECVLMPLVVCADVPMLEAFLIKGMQEGQTFGLNSVITAGTYLTDQGDLILPSTGEDLDNPFAGDTDQRDGYCCSFTKIKISVLLKNSELHPVDVVLYEVLAKHNRTNNSLAPNTLHQITDDLHNGFLAKEAGINATSLSGQAGDNLYEQEDDTVDMNDHVHSRNMQMSPYMSGTFMQNWKIVKSKKYRLQPGDEIRWKSPSVNYTYSTKKLKQRDTAEDIAIIKGVTRVLLAKISGVLGRSNAVDAHGFVGHLQAEMVYSHSCSADLLPYLTNYHGTLQVTNVVHDDLATDNKVLEAQTEHVLIAEGLQ